MSTSGSSLISDASSGSGLDVGSIVDQLIYNERAPERLMQAQQSALNDQASALKTMQSEIGQLEDAVFQLRDVLGPLNSLTATSSNTSVLTASANSTATSGTHSVTVTRLATASSYYSNAVTDNNFTFASGSKMSLQIGTGTAQNLDLSGKSLTQTASYINGLSLGVTANVVTDASGSRLTLVSNTLGAASDINISGDTTGLGWKTSSTGQNAQLTIDGIPVESATNSVSGIIPGVTLNLTSENAGSSVLLTVGPDTTETKQSISAFVSAYNTLIKDINSQFAYDQSTGTSGVLAGDSTVMSLQQSLLQGMSTKVSGGSIQTLASLGIKMGNDGTLTIDDSTLNNALTNNFSAVRTFFQSTSSGNTGFATALDATLLALNDPSGPVAADLQGVQNSSQDLSDQINNFEVRIANRQQQLTDEYTKIDVALKTFNATQAQITAQLDSLKSSQ